MTKEFQYEKVLRLLKIRSWTTMELVAQYIPAPQKAIEILRDKGHHILTESIEGKTHKKYTLIQEEKPIISNVVNGQTGLFDKSRLEAC